MTIGVVLELGEPLGYMRYAQRCELQKRIERLGGHIVSLVDDSVRLVVSREVGKDEFDTSLVLQQALKGNIPIVHTTFVAHVEQQAAGNADALGDAVAHRADVSKHLIRIPAQCIEALTAAMQFTTLDKAATIVVVEDYQEQRAIQHIKNGMTEPAGWPAWTLAQLEAYDVVRESMCGNDSYKVELHCGVNGNAAMSTQLRAPSLLPFRIMISREGSPIGHGAAIFLSDADIANRRFAAEVDKHGGHDPTRPPMRSYGSVRSCAIPMDVAQLMAHQQPLDPIVERLIHCLFTASWRQLSGIAACTANAGGDSALMGKTLMEVVKAEAILQCIGALLASEGAPPAARLRELSAQYFKIVPRGSWLPDESIATPKALELACDATRCLRAMLSTGEACCGNIYNAPPYVQLASLHTIVRPLEATSAAFKQVVQMIQGSAPLSGSKAAPPQIANLFSIRNEASLQTFRSASNHMSNHRLLFHGTACGNAVPILGQGLQLPLVARLRRDAGMLGRGIYFGDSIHTALRYCGAPSEDGTCFVFVSLVALGRVCEVRHHRKDLTHAPEGYDSVHGVRTDDPTQGDFSEDEFVVYRAEQVTVEFLLEVKWACAPQTTGLLGASANVALPAPQTYAPASRNGQGPVADFVAPTVKAVESGLRTASGEQVPLCNTRFRARIVDLIAEVDVLQQYRNHSDSVLETKYVFPLQSGCAVCAFEAYINDKKIVGRVKEKEEARREYKAAVERGDGAYLMDESEETPDVFTVSVGNLPPLTDVVIRITYLLELRVHPALQAVEFIIPSGLVPVAGRADAMRVKTQTQTLTQWADGVAAGGTVGIEVSLDMPFDILRVECSHAQVLRRKRSACRAVLKADAVDLASRDFVLYTAIASITTPRIWIETHPCKPSRAAMITFFPELPLDANASANVCHKEVLLLIDCSASMRDGSAMHSAKQAAIMCLRALPHTWYVNVLLFGSSYVYLFPKSRKASLAVVEEAVGYIQTVAGPWLGGSCLRTLLPALGRFACLADATLDVMLISDGLMTDGDRQLFQTLEDLPALRVFPLVVGKASNPTLMRSMGIAGRGQTEVLSDATKSHWVPSVDAQVRRIGQDALSSIRVDWCTEESRRLRDATNATVVQSPQHVATVFRNESTVVYGIIRHNAVQCELTASQSGKLVERDAYDCWPSQSFLVTANSTSFVSGTIVHRLCAKARIREYTDGLLSLESTVAHEAQKDLTKAAIVAIGCEHGLVTPFTSMIAVEERTREERAGRAAKVPTPSIDDIGASVDILPEEPFEDVLHSDDDGAAFSAFSVVSKRHKRQLREEQRRRAEARQRRIDDDWVHVAERRSSLGAADAEGTYRAAKDEELSEDSDADMGQRDGSSRLLFHYEAPEVRATTSSLASTGCVADSSSSSSATHASDLPMCFNAMDCGGIDSDDDDDGDDDGVYSNAECSEGSICEKLCLEEEAAEPVKGAASEAFPVGRGRGGGGRSRNMVKGAIDDSEVGDDLWNAEFCEAGAAAPQSWEDIQAPARPQSPPQIQSRQQEAQPTDQHPMKAKKRSSMPPPPPAEACRAPPAQPPAPLQHTAAPKPRPTLPSAPLLPCASATCAPTPPPCLPTSALQPSTLFAAAPMGAAGGGGVGPVHSAFNAPTTHAQNARQLSVGSAAPQALQLLSRAPQPQPHAAFFNSRSVLAAAAPSPPPPPPCAPRPAAVPAVASAERFGAAAGPLGGVPPARPAAAPGGPQRRQSGVTGASLAECMLAAPISRLSATASREEQECKKKVPRAVEELSMATRRLASAEECLLTSMERVLDRGEALESLACRSEELAAEAVSFKRAAKNQRQALSNTSRSLAPQGGKARNRTASNEQCAAPTSLDNDRVCFGVADEQLRRDADDGVLMSRRDMDEDNERVLGGENNEDDDRACLADALRSVSDSSGYLTADGLRRVMTSLGEKIDDKELDEMCLAFGGSGPMHYTQLLDEAFDKGPPKWSEGALRLGNLPPHFTTALLPSGIQRELVNRCPATGMCLGSAVVDYGVGSSALSAEALMHTIGYVVILCEVHGWSWALMQRQHGLADADLRTALMEELCTKQQVQIADAIAQAQSYHVRSGGSLASCAAALEALVGTLDAVFGLPSGGLWALMSMQDPVSGGTAGSGKAALLCASRFGTVETFLDALAAIVGRSGDRSCEAAQLEAQLKRYSSTYYPPWDAFVPLSHGLPAGATSPQPFPFLVVEQRARNYYDDILSP